MGAQRQAIARAKNASAPHHGPSRLAPSDRRNEAFDFCRDQPSQLLARIPIELAMVNPMPIARSGLRSPVSTCVRTMWMSDGRYTPTPTGEETTMAMPRSQPP